MNSNNPMFKQNQISAAKSYRVGDDVMTVTGTTNKALILLGLVLITATWAYTGEKMALALPMGILALILAIATSFKSQWAHVTAPAYALCEGVVLGAVSCMADQRYPGVAIQAMVATSSTFAAMFFFYRTKMIQATPGFTRGIMIATMGIALTALVSLGLSFFGVSNPLMANNSMFGLIFSIVCVGVASLNLILDFSFIENSAAQRAPKQFEWFGAFGLMVTLVWLYMEILRLLMRLRSSRD